MRKAKTETLQLQASITGFNGTLWGKKCSSGEELLHCWIKSRTQKRDVGILKVYQQAKPYAQQLCEKLKGPNKIK